MIDVLIIGGGPAGITASIYAARSGLNTLLLEKETFGGQIASSPKVENFPSIISISGEELVSRMLEQALEFGVSVDVENVTAVNKVDDYFEVGGRKVKAPGKWSFINLCACFSIGCLT